MAISFLSSSRAASSPTASRSVSVSGFANLTSPSFALLSPTTDITFQDTLTYTRGPATPSAPGSRCRATGRIRTAARPIWATSRFNPSGNPNSTSNALADALLGNFRTYNEASADPVGFFRFTSYQAFVSDTWRVRSNLSLELGLRYEYSTADLRAGQQPRQLRSRRSTIRRRP